MTTQGLMLCLTISLPLVIVAAVVGLLVSFLQAATSMQESTVPHLCKLIAVTITLMIVAPMSCAALLRYANDMMRVMLPT
jgi:type III secretion protein S